MEEFNKEAAVDNTTIKQGLPLGVAFGAGSGLTHALMSDPEYDPVTGTKKSKIKKVILETILGSAAGGIAGIAGADIVKQIQA